MNWRGPVPNEWEIRMIYDRFPDGCAKGCLCVHPADDCGCDDCGYRHAYRTMKSKLSKRQITIRLN
jgi:hypothetical protein